MEPKQIYSFFIINQEWKVYLVDSDSECIQSYIEECAQDNLWGLADKDNLT